MATRRNEAGWIGWIFQKNRRLVNQKGSSQTIDNPVEHIVEVDFRRQSPAEIDQRLSNVVTLPIKNLVEPNLKLILNGREQERNDNGCNHWPGSPGFKSRA